MLYLNDAHLLALGVNWNEVVEQVRDTAQLLHRKDFSQPVKPYLRYKDLKNRIIAMPAYIGGAQPSAGIKWIASFPDNIMKGIPRAHAVIILNEVNSGKPLCTFNSGLISGIRTAAVTGLLAQEYLQAQPLKNKLTVGIIGMGPIGRTHLQMFKALLGEKIEQYLVYDLMHTQTNTFPQNLQPKITVLNSWEEVYTTADIFVTCTVSKERYVNLPPRKGTLQMNISLRDYTADYHKYVDLLIVDDWEEVCRENTDIEMMHKEFGLQEEETISLAQLIVDKRFNTIGKDEVVMFNPMGMAVFDITVANYFYRLAMEKNAGVLLDD